MGLISIRAQYLLYEVSLQPWVRKTFLKEGGQNSKNGRTPFHFRPKFKVKAKKSLSLSISG